MRLSDVTELEEQEKNQCFYFFTLQYGRCAEKESMNASRAAFASTEHEAALRQTKECE